MQKEDFSSVLRFFKPLIKGGYAQKEKLAGGWTEIRTGGRSWEDYHRRRWQYDKVVRSTHGVNCTGSCSWNVYVKDGIIVWETQRGDYPDCGPESPDYEPRGCPRGATFSWYVYSPLRLKYPYMRSVLLQMWQEALETRSDPVAAWRSIVDDPLKTRKYKRARGKGGLVRVSWDQAVDLIAASLVHTIQKYGPDRIFGFTPIPAMSMVCCASGARFLSLIGASMVSFYDWYCDLPPASPQIWGDQTDVPVSGDWFNATYMIVWGTNLPMTRTPDAHFYTEARYRGAKVAAMAPDYAEYVKFADAWLPAKAGTDSALAMARTLPMVWYIPPLSPLINLSDKTNGAQVLDRLRIPVRYLANLLAAGDEAPVRLALKKLMALRAYMRSKQMAAAGGRLRPCTIAGRRGDGRDGRYAYRIAGTGRSRTDSRCGRRDVPVACRRQIPGPVRDSHGAKGRGPKSASGQGHMRLSA